VAMAFLLKMEFQNEVFLIIGKGRMVFTEMDLLGENFLEFQMMSSAKHRILTWC